MDVWKSMVSGKAIQEHMEDVYHDMIKVGSTLAASFHMRKRITLPCMVSGLQRLSHCPQDFCLP